MAQEKFGMIPKSVLLNLRCGDCLRLYGLLTLHQGPIGRPLRGLSSITDALSWQARTAKKHALHLEDAGLVTLSARSANGGWSSVRFTVVHNPSWERVAEPRNVPGVWEPPTPRWKAPSKWPDIANAAHTAPSVTDQQEHNAPSVSEDAHRASAPRTPRPIADANAMRTAPSGPRSTRSVVGLGLPAQPQSSPFGEPCIACGSPDSAYSATAVRTSDGWWGWFCEVHGGDAVALVGELIREGHTPDIVAQEDETFSPARRSA